MHLSLTSNDCTADYVIQATPGGYWVVSDRAGHEGGTFRSREAAVRFVRHTCFNSRCRIVVVAGDTRETEAA